MCTGSLWPVFLIDIPSQIAPLSASLFAVAGVLAIMTPSLVFSPPWHQTIEPSVMSPKTSWHAVIVTSSAHVETVEIGCNF